MKHGPPESDDDGYFVWLLVAATVLLALVGFSIVNCLINTLFYD